MYLKKYLMIIIYYIYILLYILYSAPWLMASLLSFVVIKENGLNGSDLMPFRSVCTEQTISRCFRTEIALSASSSAFHFLAVFISGGLLRISGSLESRSIITFLTFRALKFSTIEVRGSCKAPFARYSTEVLVILGNPSHFLI